ncbi:MAG: helix-turn-helix domain-containing protein [Alphaproteobacteria bacterium]|nr:helix-turn-helix domain-containing protein [Alphaproteobacteria bacterium]
MAYPKAVDAHVGQRVRLRRTLLGMSQEKLGEAIGLTFQQIQKYERGANRIGASRLYQFCQVLDVPVSFFFDDMSNEVKAAVATGFGEDAARFAHDEGGEGGGTPKELTKRETLELVRAYYRVPSPELRKKVFELVKAVAGKDPNERRGRPRKKPREE